MVALTFTWRQTALELVPNLAPTSVREGILTAAELFYVSRTVRLGWLSQWSKYTKNYASKIHLSSERACKEDAKKPSKHHVILSVISPPVLLSGFLMLTSIWYICFILIFLLYGFSACKYLKCPQGTYPALYIQFNFIMFVDFTPEIINSAACGETINFAGLWCILKTLMIMLLMYLSQRDQAFKITPVLFCPPFFFPVNKNCICMWYIKKALGFCIYTLKLCLDFIFFFHFNNTITLW